MCRASREFCVSKSKSSRYQSSITCFCYPGVCHGSVSLSMENSYLLGSAKQESPDELPTLFQCSALNAVPGFDDNRNNAVFDFHTQPTGTDVVALQIQPNVLKTRFYAKPSITTSVSHRLHHASISMPSPYVLHSELSNRVLLSDNLEQNVSDGIVNCPANATTATIEKPKLAKFHSHPILAGTAYVEAMAEGRCPDPLGQPQGKLKNNRIRNNTFDSFKTKPWSGKLERQISMLRGKKQDEKPDNHSQNFEAEALPVDCYFAALQGPELDSLRDTEESVLPKDQQWPFLLRFPISSFGICLGLSSQAILWKTLSTDPSMAFLHISPIINLVLWCISIAVTAIVSIIYSLKLIFYFEAVRREYYHPVRVNFFFAPWISFMFLALGVPPLLTRNLPELLWYILMAPIFCLELKLYGQWMSGGQRRLSKVANPLNHLSIIGNFVGALLGASMGLKEGPMFFFAIGLAHYAVLFVTLYQRLPTNETLPKELHPVFFLFVAAPSVASMAWAKIEGDFDTGSKLAYFVALFLYSSLVVRINFFYGIRFSLAWWAYTFPMTGASIATIKYSNKVKNPITQSLSIILSTIATLIVTALLISTAIHAFVHRNLFPNDIAIAIAGKRPKTSKLYFDLKSLVSNPKDIEACDLVTGH